MLKETLGALDLLDRVPSALMPPDARRALDIGSKNWAYSPALAAWFARNGKSAVARRYLGVELDAYRLYPDLTTRLSHGRANARAFSGKGLEMEYRAGDLLEAVAPGDGHFQLVTWLLPFVSEEPHRAWGLPRSRFRPEALFSRAAQLMDAGGLLVMVNQGEWEWERARSMLAKLPALQARGSLEIEGSLHASPYTLFLSFWTRVA